MPKISEKNPRYRTKQEICEDVAFILQCKNLRRGTKHAVLAEVTWVWSEFNGKHQGCPYWSRKASASKVKEDLIHEHLVPKAIILEKLFKLSSPSTAKVKKILNKYCIGVVVTREEDQRLNDLGLRSAMPEDWDGEDVWARHRAANIQAVEIRG